MPHLCISNASEPHFAIICLETMHAHLLWKSRLIQICKLAMHHSPLHLGLYPLDALLFAKIFLCPC